MGHDHMHAHGSPLGFTGERVLPDQPEWSWCFQAHKFGYDDLLARLPAKADVLDIGCGEGYGASELALRAASVTACDYSPDAVRHAANKYGRAIRWSVCDAQRLPFGDHLFDVVSSLQVIEHFTDTDAHLADVARVLRPGGWHYCATPNIDNMSPEEADNEYHLRDFNAADLHAAMIKHFHEVEVLGMFYREDSARVVAMRAAEADFARTQPKLEIVEKLVSKLPGPLRVKARPLARRIAGVPRIDFNAARNAIRAEDFQARAPAEESFCLIAIARGPRR
jgi:ubiquinone/menaquinone biosynthesis C-methylase UbiE